MRELNRQPDVMRDILKRKMLRGACSAISWLVAAQRGLTERASEDQFRAAAVLARLAPNLVGELQSDPDEFDKPQYSTPRALELLESLCDGDTSREELATWWARCYRQHGPQPPHFTTLAEARDYGRKRWDAQNAASDDGNSDLAQRVEDICAEGEVTK
jgi:hypothetical protein